MSEQNPPNTTATRIVQVPFAEYLALLQARDDNESLKARIAELEALRNRDLIEAGRLMAESVARKEHLLNIQRDLAEYRRRYEARVSVCEQAIRNLIEALPHTQEGLLRYFAGDALVKVVREAKELLSLMEAVPKERPVDMQGG